MNNLVIAVIAIAFAAALSLAGVNHVDRRADVAHTEQVNNTAQVENLVSDYESLMQTVGHRPTAADYQAVYAARSGSTYAYGAAGNPVITAPSKMTTPAGSAAPQWTYMPGCNGGTQDCFYMTMQGSSDTIYRAAKLSAMQELNTPTVSRIELSATRADDPNAVTNPASWPASTPSTYYLTLRLAPGTVTSTTQTVQYYYTANPTYYLPAPACGETIKVLNTGWTCTQQPGGASVAESYCATPAATEPTTDMTGCVSYSCQPGAPSACVSGEVTYPCDCYSSAGIMVGVNDSHCVVPASYTQACPSSGTSSGSGSTSTSSGGTSTPAPTAPTSGSGTPAYSYIVSNIQYGSCTAACGSSTQPASSYTCTRSDGTPVSPTLCGTPAGLPCTSYSTCTVQNASYGACSNQCGSGTASLSSYQCGDSSGNYVANSNCTAPAATESCTSTSGCTYTWSGATYGTCLPACGASTAAVLGGTCTRSDGTVVNAVYCYNAGEISLTQACTNYSLCTANATYGACSNTCGVGTQHLTGSTCTSSTGAPLPASDCPAPAPVQACVGTSSCTYTASAPVYNACSSSCGSGTQTVASFTCTRSDGTVVASSYCTAPAAKSCSSYAGCTVTGANYGACSNQCGSGTQTLANNNWTCTDGNGNTVPRTYCTPPAGVQSCYGTGSCTYRPTNVVYGQCQPACGASTKSVSWTCQRSDGTTVANSYCTPPANQTCTDHSQCSAVGNYSACSNTCGSGQETLQSWSCYGPTGTPAPDGQSDCTAPASTKTCTSTTGCSYTATPVYNACAPGCGASTQSLSSYTCEDQHGNVVSNSNCTAPASSISCTDNTQCGTVSYRSVPTSFGSCQETNCGGQSTLQVLTYECYKDNTTSSGTTETVVDNSYCSAPVGPTCTYSGGCYNYSYQNPVYSGACSTTCGPGTQPLTSYQCYRTDASGQSVQITGSAMTSNSNCSASSLGIPATAPCSPANAACH